MTMRQEDIDYFNRGIVENPCYWSRLGGKPDFTNLVVGDLGCGHGSLCMDVAMSGAKRVIGFDLNARLIDFGNENMHGNYPQLANVVEFRYQDVRESPESDIDCFVSKDTFEHVLDLSQVLDAMKTRLKPGGRIYAGFGPLWNSPFGDHGRLKMRFPWGHVAFSEKHLITRLNRLNGIDGPKAASIHDLGLNKFSLADYRQIFKECGMSVVFFRVNSSTRPISKVFSLICRIPLTREYFSHNIYCILEKPK
jgi:SAM-dependent methyltransferase